MDGNLRITKCINYFINPDGKKQINQYVFKDKIGSGSYSKVYKILNMHDRKYYAAKVINKKKIRNRMIVMGHKKIEIDLAFYKEISIMKNHSHKNICSLIEVIDDDGHDTKPHKLY